MTTRTAAAAALAALAALALQAGAADRAFRGGDHPRAAELYRAEVDAGEESPALRYNLGTALLRAGRWEEARAELARAHAPDADAGVRWRAHYNAGNTDLEPAYLPAPRRAREALERAVQAYRAALLLEPGDLDAKWNLELAQRLLDELPDSPTAGGGGGGGDDQAPAAPDASPDAAGPGADAPDLTPQQAADVVDRAAQAESAVQRARLRRAQQPPPNVRDW